MTTEEIIQIFKDCCADPAFRKQVADAIKYQNQRDVWKFYGEGFQILIYDFETSAEIVYIVRTPSASLKYEKDITIEQYCELKKLYFGDL